MFEARRGAVPVLIAGAMLAMAACGGSGGDSDVAAEAPATTTTTAPLGEVILEDTFDDDANEWSPEDVNDDRVTGEISDSALRVQVDTSLYEGLSEAQVPIPLLVWPSAIDDRAPELSDVRAEAVLSERRGAVAGLACGIDPTNVDLRSYFFTVSSAGLFTIAKLTSDNQLITLAQTPEVIDDSPSAPITLPPEPAFEFDPDTDYELAIECHGSPEATDLRFEVDGEQVLSATDTDDPIEAGLPAVTVNESSAIYAVEGFQPFDVTFEEFSAFDLGDGSDDSEAGDAAEGVGFDPSTCADELDDLTNDKGTPRPGLNAPGTDVTEVSLAADGQDLTATFAVEGGLPGTSEGISDQPLRWGVAIERSDGAQILIQATLDGNDLAALIDDQGDSEDPVPGEVEADRGTLTVTVPADALDLSDGFTWGAFTEWFPVDSTDRIDDICPETAGDALEVQPT